MNKNDIYMDRKIILEENEEEQEEIKYLSIYMLSSVKLYNYIYKYSTLTR
jgi:hypothetical protein